MSPSLMDTRDGPNSPCSLSAEESNSNTAGSEREGDGQQVGHTGGKRREKNRNAARKTRRKQTERADELHEELQHLEQSNSSLQNEIAGLQKNLQRYTKALARHEPYCCLRASASTSRKHVSASHSGGCQSTSGPPPRFAPQAPSSILATPPLVSSSLGLQAHLSSSASPQTFSLSSRLSAKLVLPSYSGPATLPYSVPDRHSLFRKEPPNTTSPTGVTPLCTSLLSTSITSSILTAAAQPQSGRDIIHGTSSVPANACFPLNSGTLDAFLIKQTSVVPPYQHLAVETGGPVFQACPMNVPQLPLGQHSGNPNGSSPLLPPTLQDPAVQSPQANLELPFAAASFGYRQQTPNQESLLSLLTIPSPLNSSSSSDALVCQPPPSQPLPGDPSSDLSLSELLEIDDWILSGTSDQ
ncbi:protein c-Fos [Hippoglossus stenolepis]|uniref:protein c-Fos n=1 Tax=Hippoglossus stenolepis TaxID=195615 RepID=UPI00159CBBE7|nr:protein c-Fos [Hippoglossus stenolepis]